MDFKSAWQSTDLRGPLRCVTSASTWLKFKAVIFFRWRSNWPIVLETIWFGQYRKCNANGFAKGWMVLAYPLESTFSSLEESTSRHKLFFSNCFRCKCCDFFYVHQVFNGYHLKIHRRWGSRAGLLENQHEAMQKSPRVSHSFRCQKEQSAMLKKNYDAMPAMKLAAAILHDIRELGLRLDMRQSAEATHIPLTTTKKEFIGGSLLAFSAGLLGDQAAICSDWQKQIRKHLVHGRFSRKASSGAGRRFLSLRLLWPCTGETKPESRLTSKCKENVALWLIKGHFSIQTNTLVLRRAAGDCFDFPALLALWCELPICQHKTLLCSPFPNNLLRPV